LITPARSIAPAATARRWAADLSDEPSGAEIRQMMVLARQATSTAERLEDLLHPFTSFFVLPVFALANAGVVLHRGMLSAPGALTVAVAVAVALVGGKFVGVLAGSWIAVRSGVAVLPEDVGWRHVVGIAALAGIGFTVALFVTGLAFTEERLADAAKLGILAGSAIAAALGALLLALVGRADRQDVKA
jgi:NhaA family Na+:H+ antiporter